MSILVVRTALGSKELCSSRPGSPHSSPDVKELQPRMCLPVRGREVNQHFLGRGNHISRGPEAQPGGGEGDREERD